MKSRSSRRTGVAVVIGVERYRANLPPAKHARNDAEQFAAFAQQTLGIPKERIRLLTDDQATSADLREALQEWLPMQVSEGSSVWIYFSGHGTPGKDGESVLVPYDADPADLTRRGTRLQDVAKLLEGLPAKERFLVVDACFSGLGGRSVVDEGKRPLVPVAPMPKPSGSTLIFTATEPQGVSGPARGSAHGLFTHHFLHGLRGAADGDADGAVTASELGRFVRQQVVKESSEQGSPQTPVVHLGTGEGLVVVDEPVMGAPLEPAPPAASAVTTKVDPAPEAKAATGGGLGAIFAQASVAGAELLLDGEPTGLWAPATLNDLVPGTYSLEARTPTHVARQTVTVGGGERAAVRLKLEPSILETFELRSEPPGAALTLDGKPLGPAPQVIRNLPAGPHTVLAQAEGREPTEQSVTVTREQRGLTVELPFVDRNVVTVSVLPPTVAYERRIGSWFGVGARAQLPVSLALCLASCSDWTAGRTIEPGLEGGADGTFHLMPPGSAYDATVSLGAGMGVRQNFVYPYLAFPRLAVGGRYRWVSLTVEATTTTSILYGYAPPELLLRPTLAAAFAF